MSDDRPPLRDVVMVSEVEGPRGGKIMVMRMACGHSMWERRKTPPTQKRCMGCWVDAKLGPSPGWLDRLIKHLDTLPVWKCDPYDAGVCTDHVDGALDTAREAVARTLQSLLGRRL